MYRYAEFRVSPWRYVWLRMTRSFRRPQRWPDDGVDYTGWSARLLQPMGRAIAAGAQGRVTGYQQERQGKFWTVVFPGVSADEVDYLTALPAPGKVDLLPPT